MQRNGGELLCFDGTGALIRPFGTVFGCWVSVGRPKTGLLCFCTKRSTARVHEIRHVYVFVMEIRDMLCYDLGLIGDSWSDWEFIAKTSVFTTSN